MKRSFFCESALSRVIVALTTIAYVLILGAAVATLFSCKKSSSSCVPPVVASGLNVTLDGQQTDSWCWAASGQMVMQFLGTSVTQCDEANKRFNYTDCCNSPTPTACIQGGWPEFDKYGFTFKRTTDAALSWDQVKDQIYCQHKPFAFSWHWNGGGGHMMVLTGYLHFPFGQSELVFINDPWPPNAGDKTIMTYQNYVSGPGHTHWDDFYDVTK
jgi:Papain-like cysteine protease AvrRpt2